jgi:hypothetical protein
MSKSSNSNQSASMPIHVLIECEDANYAQAIEHELNTFAWPYSVKINLLRTSEEETLRTLVPIIESKQAVILCAQGERAAELVHKAYRYLSYPFILHVISNNLKHASGFIPAFTDSGLQNLLRYDSSAVQWHLIDQGEIHMLEDAGSRLIRLGELKQNIIIAEAALRDANCVLIDVEALKKSEFTDKPSTHQSGLSSEEACQLMRYTGFSNKSECISIGGFTGKNTDDGRSVNVLAQLIYYACDGIANRKSELSDLGAHVTKYHIENDDFDFPFVFLKGNKSDRWWLSIKDLTLPERLQNHLYYPCSKEDFDLAMLGEPSETLIKAQIWFDQLLQLNVEKK